MSTENNPNPFVLTQRNFTGYATLADATTGLLYKYPGQIVYAIDVTTFYYWDGAAWQTLSTGGGGGSSIYAGASPTTITVGGLPSGSVIAGETYDAIFQDILVPYVAPAFTSFSISGQTTTVEVGTTLSGSKTFLWGISTPLNVQANSVLIRDVTGAVDLATGLANDGTEAIVLPTPIQLILPGSYSWRATATNTVATTFNSSNFTVNWQWRIYYGTSALTSLSEATIESLATNGLQSSKNNTYALGAGDYKYICYPDSFGSPTIGTGIKDAGTGFAIAMADVTDNGFFSNVQNGWYYGLVSVTNVNGITTNYRVYRTKNTLGGTINITIS